MIRSKTAITAMTSKMWMIPVAPYAKYPSAHRITRMMAIKYNKLLMAFNFEFDEIQFMWYSPTRALV